LLFNTLSLSSAVALSYAQIFGVLDHASRGLGKVKDNDDKHRAPANVARAVVFILSLVPIYFLVLGTAGTMALFVTSVPALIAFVHVAVVQLLFVCVLLSAALYWAFRKDLDSQTLSGASPFGLVDHAFYRIRCAFADVFRCRVSIRSMSENECGGRNHDYEYDADEGELDDDRSFAQRVMIGLILWFACLQTFQGLGIFSWNLYLSGDDWKTLYIALNKDFFAAFSLPPFSWHFNLRYYFDMQLWQRIFSLRLEEFELFGTAIAIQLVTVLTMVLRRGMGMLPQSCSVDNMSRMVCDAWYACKRRNDDRNAQSEFPGKKSQELTSRSNPISGLEC
jgi:hypothetical protein